MCGLFTGVMAAGGDTALFEYNLPVREDARSGADKLPEELYLATMKDDGTADMSTAIRVY